MCQNNLNSLPGIRTAGFRREPTLFSCMLFPAPAFVLFFSLVYRIEVISQNLNTHLWLFRNSRVSLLFHALLKNRNTSQLSKIELLLRKSESCCFHPGSADVVVRLSSRIIIGMKTPRALPTCQVDGLGRVFPAAQGKAAQCSERCTFSQFELHCSLTAALQTVWRKERDLT